MERQLRFACLSRQEGSVVVELLQTILRDHPELDVNALAPFEAPLHTAVLNRNVDAVRILLQDPRTDVNVRDIWGTTPLHLLFDGRGRCSRNSFDGAVVDSKVLPIFQLLLEAGADVNAIDNKGQLGTPLCCAVRAFGSPKRVIESLLDAGARIMIGGAGGMSHVPANQAAIVAMETTPLHAACSAINIGIANLLLDRISLRQVELCLCARNKAQATPMDHLRAKEGHQSMMLRRLLCDWYARAIVDRRGAYCVNYALKHGAQTYKTYDYIRQRKGMELKSQQLWFKLPFGDLNEEEMNIFLKMLISLMPDSLHTPNKKEGLIPVQVACQLNMPVTVIYLLLRNLPLIN